MTKDEDALLNQQTDARTNQRVEQLPLPSPDMAGLSRLREQWQGLPMIPRIVLDRREGTDNSWPGFDVRTILVGEESAGRFTFHDVLIAPGAGLATHHLQGSDTYWVVLDGAVELTVGARTERTQRDGMAFIPENSPQAIRNGSSEPARLFLWHSPAGPERAFALAHKLWLEKPAATAEECERALSTLGFVFHGGEQSRNTVAANPLATRIEARIETFDDYSKLRSEWSRRPPVSKLLHDRGVAADIPMRGQDTKVLLSGDESAGRCTVFHYGIEPDYRAPPHHQPSEEEIFMVLEGELELTAGNRTCSVPRGGFGFVPRYATHAFANRTKTLTRTITLNSPSGHERGFEMIVREGPSEKLPRLLVAHGWRVHEQYDPSSRE